jgi:hypothetical protein
VSLFWQVPANRGNDNNPGLKKQFYRIR